LTPGQWDQSHDGYSPQTGPFVAGHNGQYVDYAASRRPWWGLGDVLLSIPFILILAIAGAFLALPLLSGDDRSGMLDGTITPPAVMGMGLIFQQAAQGGWPFIISKWKGLGPKADWRLRFKPIDLGIGLLTAVGVLIVVAILSFVFTALVDQSTLDESGNTSFLNDAEGSPWLYVLIFGAVVGAPVVEEIFFRGLVMRAFEKRFAPSRSGKFWAVLLSTVVFVIPHFTGAGLVPTLILFATIGVVGAVLGTLAMVTDRLGPAIIAHMLFNAIGVLGALATDSEDAASLLWSLPI